MGIDRLYVFVLTILFIYRQEIPDDLVTEVFQRINFYTHFRSVQMLEVD